MAAVFDPETLETFRHLSPRDVYDQVRRHVYRSGGATSEDFRDAFDELVEQGILTWQQIEDLEG